MQHQNGAGAGFTLTPGMAQALLQAQAAGAQLAGMPGAALLTQRLAVLPAGARQQAYRGGGQSKPQSRKGAAGGGNKGRKSCNCKNSKCLKLYCECFASGRYCDNCNCVSCQNNTESEVTRQAAVESILERNPNAFRPKIQTAEGDTNPQSVRNAPDGSVRHSKGCNCKKSSCLKKYCECFQGNIYCTAICKCVDCKNYDGSDSRGPPGGGDFMQQAMQQHALKQQRPRLQMSAAGQQMLQPQQMLQQLTAAAAAGGGVPAGLTALQLHGLSGSLSALASPAGLTGPAPTPAAQAQQPSRPALHEAMHALVVPESLDGVTSRLAMVADQAEAAEQNGAKRQRDDSGGGEAAAKVARSGSGEADGLAAAGDDASAAADGPSALFVAQEGVVLAEFNSILQQMLQQATSNAHEAAAAAAASAALADAAGDMDVAADNAAVAAAVAAAGGFEGFDQQLLLEQLEQQADLNKSFAGLAAALAQQQQQQQQAGLAAHQALLLQAAAASGNLGLLQASRGLMLPGLQLQQQQQQLMLPGGGGATMGLQLRGLAGGMGMLPGVMGQDGAGQLLPPSALASLQQMAAAGLQQQQQQQHAAAQPAAAGPGAQISLLSLLNGGTGGS